MTTSPESQRATARNLVSSLAVAWHSARTTGQPYSVTESDAVGHLSGWVGLSSLAGLMAGYTTVCEVRPDATAEDVVKLMASVACVRKLTDPGAQQILDEFAARVAGQNLEPGPGVPGKVPGVPEAQPEGGPVRFHLEGPGESTGAKPGLLPGMGGE